MRIWTVFIMLLAYTCIVNARTDESITTGLGIASETQISTSKGTTPLWLNANKYGMSSLESSNGYERLSAIRPVEADSNRLFRIGYGIDVALASGYASNVVLQQAFAEVQWKKIALTVGAKHQPIELKNQELSSGALTFGCNARPIPQMALDIDWFDMPYTNGYLQWKFHGSYGMTTDGNYIESLAKSDVAHYTGNILYHEKAAYLKIGKASNKRMPLTFELSLQMAAQFGGTSYNVIGRDIEGSSTIKHDVSLKAFLQALTATGSGETDGSSKNVAGNHLGSWNMRLTWHGDDWKVAARFERFFEDQSMMTVQYGIYDHLLGIDATFPANRIIGNITLEHISTYNQSGAILHDAAPNIPDKMNGRDNYYNHDMYMGHQHWGQAIGNPLLTSPIYNTNGNISFLNNRIKAWHVGITGSPANWLQWRMLMTFSRNYGTYDIPFDDPCSQNYFLAEATIRPVKSKNWQYNIALGIDHGKVIGNNYGMQLTVRRAIKL